MTYYSQYGQDKFIDENIFKNSIGGFFLEMGADDGVTHSNTLFFEQWRSWKGICVEPRKTAFEKLKINRTCHCENVCISNEHRKKVFLEVAGEAAQLSGLLEKYDKKHLERVHRETDSTKEIEVECITLNDLLKKYGVKIIDYFSLDVEGGELEILSSIDFSAIRINCISVENNYKSPAIKQFLSSKGYRRCAEVGIDEIYVIKNSKLDIYREPSSVRFHRAYGRLKNVIKRIIRYGTAKRIYRYFSSWPADRSSDLSGRTPKKIIEKIIGVGDLGLSNKTTREAWLKEKLEAVPDGDSILDAGAGELQYKKFCGHLNYTSQDFAKYDGKGNQAALQPGSWDNSKLDIVSDISAIPRNDASFDAVMCVEVLEHLPYPNEAFKEFARLLKPGGKLIVTSPFCSLTHFAPYHFSTGFSKYFYEEVLSSNGFKVLEITPNGNYYGYLAQEIRRLPSIANKYSHSKMNIFEKILIKMILGTLNKYNKTDQGSSELLCFGYHVLAQKIK